MGNNFALITGGEPPANDAEAVKYPYTHFHVTSSFFYDDGTVCMTPASDEGESIDVRLHAPRGWKLVEFVVQRRGKAPDIPAIEMDSNLKLLQSAIVPMAPLPIVPFQSN